MFRDKCSEHANQALRSIIATLNAEVPSHEVRVADDATCSHEASNLPSKVVVVDAATFNTAKSNVPYFSLNTSCKSHQDEEVIHDVNDWLRLINRELFEHSDQTKCSVALSRALGTAKSLIDKLIDSHNGNWDTISTEYKAQCRQPQDCKQLQIEILSLKRNHNESLQALYMRASRLRTKLLRVKPQHEQWVQEELYESFAKAVSMKFFYEEERRLKAGEKKGDVRSLLPKALEFEAKQSAIRVSEESDKGLSIDTPDSNDKLVHAVSDISPSSAEPEYSKNSTGRRNRRISKRCYRCNSPHHLWRLCDQPQEIASHHTRGPYFTALLGCFRCGSNQHATAECYRNHKVCFRCRCRGHVARECFSTPSDRKTTRSNVHKNEKAIRTTFIASQQNHQDTAVTTAHHHRDSSLSSTRTLEEPIIRRREMIINKEEPEQPINNFIGGLYMSRLEDVKYHTDKKLEALLKRCE